MNSATSVWQIANRYLHALLAHSLTGWVGVGYQADLENTIVRGLISDYCLDYITLPSSDDRLVDAVGHAYKLAALQINLSVDAAADHPEDEMIGVL